METTPKVVQLAEKLAKTYMTGVRKGNPRPAWAHPEDVVALVKMVPGIRPDTGTQCFLEAVAWLHDVLEDTTLTEESLHEAGIPDHVIMGVKMLTKASWMTPHFYFRGVDGAPELVKIVKLCDRLANLTEGKGVLPETWWRQYTYETKHFVVPMAEDMGEPWKTWLVSKLEAVMV